MKIRDVVKGLCCSFMLMSGVASGCVSGVEYSNGRVGYFLMDGARSDWTPIKSIDEYLGYAPEYNVDLPVTQETFKEFMGYSALKKFNAYFRVGVEVVLGSINHEDLEKVFQRIESFVLLTKRSGYSNAEKEEMLQSLTSALEDNFYQLMISTKNNEITEEDESVLVLKNKCNALFEKLDIPDRFV